MTTTIVAGTMTVTLTELVVLKDADDNDHGVNVTNEFTVGSVATFVKRLVTIPTSEVGVLAFAADLATAPAATAANTYVAGHFDQDLVRYIRITNKDDTNHVTLRFRATDGAEFGVKLEPGQSYAYSCDATTGTVATMDADASATTIVLQDLEDITALADTATVDLEVFVASI